MTITILRKKLDYSSNYPYSEIEEIEICEYRWECGHKLSFVRKNSAHFENLKDNEDIIGMKL